MSWGKKSGSLVRCFHHH